MTDDEKDWRHIVHYDFAQNALPNLIFREFAEKGTAFFDTGGIFHKWVEGSDRDEAGEGPLTLSQLWNVWLHREEDFPRKDLITKHTDFSTVFRFDKNRDWMMAVITPPPALKAPEAQQIGFFCSSFIYRSIEIQLVEATNEFEERGLPLDIDNPVWVNCYLRYICLEKATPVGGIEFSGFHIGEWMSDGSRDNLGPVDEATIEKTFNVMEYLIAQDNRFKQ